MPLFVLVVLRSRVDQSQSFPKHSFLHHHPRARVGDSLFSLGYLLSPFSIDVTQTCTLYSLESLFEWLCTTSLFLFLLIQSGMSLACRNSSLVFVLFHWSYNLSPKGSLMPFPHLFMVFLALFLHIFRSLASPSKHDFLLPSHLLLLPFDPSDLDPSIVYSIYPCHYLWPIVQY